MTPLARRGTVLLAVAAGVAAQFLLQQPLARANQVRSSRKLLVPPSSLAFRLAAGGVKEAAGDALWLSVLPKLGVPWAEPERKAAWIESVTGVMADANPRSLYPIIYGSEFIEFIDHRHPAIERVLEHGMEIEKRGPFGVTTRPNRDDWSLPEALGMNLVLYGKTPGERERGIAWLKTAASKPSCPIIVIDYVAGLGAREGNPLEGWVIYGLRALQAGNKALRDRYLEEADRSRLQILFRWALAAEKRLDRWPRTLEEVLDEASPVVKSELGGNPARRAALLDGVILLPSTRDIEIRSLTDRQVEDARADLLEIVHAYEASHGRRARTLVELEGEVRRSIAPPPRHGTRWGLDPGTGEPVVVPDLTDPRMRR